jgi:hypothetical protein
MVFALRLLAFLPATLAFSLINPIPSQRSTLGSVGIKIILISSFICILHFRFVSQLCRCGQGARLSALAWLA